MELESARTGSDQPLGFIRSGSLAPDVDPHERNEHVRIARSRVQQLVVGNCPRSGPTGATGVDAPDGTRDLALSVEVGRLVRSLAAGAHALGHARERIVSRRSG